MPPAIASGESIMEPRTDSSASRLCGGTRSGLIRRTSSAALTKPAPPRTPMEPAGNASPVEPPLPAEKPWGNPIRWSCLKIPCHCPFHLHFPGGKTRWMGVYPPPPTSESHGCDSRLPSVGRPEGGLSRGLPRAAWLANASDPCSRTGSGYGSARRRPSRPAARARPCPSRRRAVVTRSRRQVAQLLRVADGPDRLDLIVHDVERNHRQRPPVGVDEDRPGLPVDLEVSGPDHAPLQSLLRGPEQQTGDVVAAVHGLREGGCLAAAVPVRDDVGGEQREEAVGIALGDRREEPARELLASLPGRLEPRPVGRALAGGAGG